MSDAPQAAATTAPVTTTQEGAAPVVAPAPDANLALRVAALTKKEVAAVKARQAAEAKVGEITQREAALAAREARLQEFETLKTANPKKALEFAGVSYEDLTKIQMNGGEVPVELQVKQLRDELAAKDKAQADARSKATQDAEAAAAAAETQAIENFKKQIADTVGDAKSYPFIASRGDPDVVFGIIDAQYGKTGKVLAIPEAAKLYEDWLRKDVTDAQKLLAPEPEVKAVVQAKVPVKQEWKPKTLTNSMAPVTSSKPKSHTTREQDIQRILGKTGV